MPCVLFPTDFSENAKHALPSAVDLAQRTGRDLVLMHVYSVRLVGAASGYAGHDEAMFGASNMVAEKAQKILDEIVADDVPKAVKVSTVLLKGDVVKEVDKYCKEHDVSIVVMGTQGATGLAEVFVGSITADVIRKVECPVLAIPMEATVKGFKRMLYATELKYGEMQRFQMVVDFARIYDASVTFLHINKGSDAVNAYEDSLLEFIKKNDYSKLSYVRMIAKDVNEGLKKYEEEHSRDLLAITTHTHSLIDRIFHKSITRKEVLHTKIPLLALSHKTHALTLVTV